MRLITIEYHHAHHGRVGYLPSMLLREDATRMIVLNVINRPQPLMVNGHCLIERGTTGIWLVDTQEWYDFGAMYDRNYQLKGYYCDITTPAVKTPTGYRTTDLLIDLCILPDGTSQWLDLEEFDDAVQKGVINKVLTEKARQSLDDLQNKIKSGRLLTSEVERLLGLPVSVDEIRVEVLKVRAQLLKDQGRSYSWITELLGYPPILDQAP